MIDVFLNYFSKFAPLNKEERKCIAESAIFKSFKKGEYLLKEGQRCMDTFFIIKGCVREFIWVNAEDKTTNFFTEGQWVISLNNFGASLPAENNLICVEDTVVSIGNEEQAQEIFKKFPRFETISRAIVEANFAEQKKILTSYLTDTPEQRYLKLIKNRPDLFQRIPLYHLASYIGVKPESLSRIRNRLIKRL